jgi:CHASE2 domain-containing sensor protein
LTNIIPAMAFYNTTMKKFYLIKESILATVITLVITFAISFLPAKFEFDKPIRQGFLDFDIYDLYYSGNHLMNTQRDTNMVLVEIGDDRDAIADQINLIQKDSPLVIGIDAVFDKESTPLDNIKLLQAISNSDNIIFASKYDKDRITGQEIFIKNFFDKKSTQYQSGYINMLGNPFSVIRNYPPFLAIDDSVYLAFTSAIVKKISPEKFDKLKKRDKKLEIINYTGNLESYTSLTKEQLQYYAATGQLKSLIAQKIVLLGYFVKDKPLVMEDLHFSPLNEQVAGKSFPDMYGVVIHANILSMILSGKYASQVSELVSYLFSGVIIFLFLLYLLSQYKKRNHPKHGWFLFIQFILILMILYLFLQVFKWVHVKIPLLPILIALVLSVELLGVYKNIALWLHRRCQYNTVFIHKHII